MDLSKVFDWLKLSPQQLFSVLLVSSILLFGNSKFLSRIGLEQFVNDYRAWIGLIWLASLGFLAGYLMTFISGKFRAQIEQFIWIRFKRKILQKLTSEEKKILREFFEKDTKTCLLPENSGVVKGLQHQRIIYPATQLGVSGFGGSVLFDYNIQPWAWNYLKSNPHLLKD